MHKPNAFWWCHYAEIVSVELGEVNKNKKTRIVLKLFGSDSLTLGLKKTVKVHGESHEI